MQVCPAPMKPPNAAPRAAVSIGVSSKTRTGDLPPSSRVALAKRRAAATEIARPTSVPPVKTTFFTRGCSVRAAPAVAPDLLGPADAARALGVTEADVMTVLESGELKGKKIGSSWRITRAALNAYLSE